MRRELFFRIAALAAIAAALYHLLAIVHPAFSRGGPPWRHGLFFAVDLACAPLLLKRPRWFVFAFAALTFETILSHGSHALRMWLTEATVDWFDFVVTAAVCFAFCSLVWDGLKRRREPAC